MRLSTSTNLFNFDRSVPYEIPMEDAILTLRKAGYTYQDANLCGMCRPGKKESSLTQDDWLERALRWRSLADREGVSFLQAHAFFAVKGSNISAGSLPDGERSEEHTSELQSRI